MLNKFHDALPPLFSVSEEETVYVPLPYTCPLNAVVNPERTVGGQITTGCAWTATALAEVPLTARRLNAPTAELVADAES
jgi:hypothetical protein